MQSDNRFFDDIARLAAGAMGTFAGMREEAEAQLRQQFERIFARMDLVSREEFEAVREMAANARAGQEALASRVAELERRLAERDAVASSGLAGGTAAAPGIRRQSAPRRRRTGPPDPG